MEDEKIDEMEITVLERAKPTPTPTSEGQFIYHHEKRATREMDVYAAKNIYRSQAEIDRAKRRGDFKIEKTMTTDVNGNIFFLCYDHRT